jgi:hypothetical protein
VILEDIVVGLWSDWLVQKAESTLSSVLMPGADATIRVYTVLAGPGAIAIALA